MTDKIFGIPGTGHIPNPEKELKKLVDKAKHDTQKAVDDICNKAEHQVVETSKQAQRNVRSVEAKVTRELNSITDLAEEKLRDLFAELSGKGVHALIDQLIDVAQEKVIQDKVYVELWWIGFRIDVDSKINTLQAIANNPPSNKGEIMTAVRSLTDDDVVVLCPNLPFAGRVNIPIKVEMLSGQIDKMLQRLGIPS